MTMTRMLGLMAAGALIGAAGSAQAAGALGGNPTAGQAVFKAQCSACHSTQAGQEGAAPSLNGVVGRTSGTEHGFSYTPAIRKADVVWTPGKLDQFLSGPAKMIPGTAMPITLSDPRQRHDVIAYLATLHK